MSSNGKLQKVGGERIMAQKNKQLSLGMKAPEDKVIIEITEDFIQQFAEDNCDRKLTPAELEELSWVVWEQEQDLLDWIYSGAMKVMNKT